MRFHRIRIGHCCPAVKVDGLSEFLVVDDQGIAHVELIETAGSDQLMRQRLVGCGCPRDRGWRVPLYELRRDVPRDFLLDGQQTSHGELVVLLPNGSALSREDLHARVQQIIAPLAQRSVDQVSRGESGRDRCQILVGAKHPRGCAPRELQR